MLAISVDTSSQVPYRSFPCRHGKSLTSLLLLFPKSLATFREPCFLCSGILNACLTRRKGQHTFSAGQPYPLADIPFFHLCAYFIFNLPNSLTSISEYHSGCTHVKILGKLELKSALSSVRICSMVFSSTPCFGNFFSSASFQISHFLFSRPLLYAILFSSNLN